MMNSSFLWFPILAAVATTTMEVPIARIIDDARLVDRVAGAAKHDLPRDLLRRIVTEDIEFMRGRRNDGTYQYAGYERFESGRTSDSFSVQARDEKLEIRGSFAYRLIMQMPSRRMLVTKNRRVYIDHVEIDYIPEKGNSPKLQKVNINAWIEPGDTKTVDFDDVAKQSTVRVYARTDKDSGYGNIVLSLIQARVFDHPDSPYADAVASEKAILRALDHGDIGSMRAMATRIINDLQPAVATEGGGAQKNVEVVAPRVDADLYNELQAIEDLLTGNETERRQGLDRLHQLVRKLRAASTATR
jgi:hypothetical protein